MTPRIRDRNRARVRRLTGAIAGAALAACGLFAGLAASATQHVFSSTTTKTQTATRTQTQTVTTTAQKKAAPATTTQATPTVTVMPTQSAPVATSGGS